MTYNPQHTNFVGYRGLVLLDNVLLLASSGDVTFAAAPIKSSANWGAGSWNAAETVAWSADMPTIDAIRNKVREAGGEAHVVKTR